MNFSFFFGPLFLFLCERKIDEGQSKLMIG